MPRFDKMMMFMVLSVSNVRQTFDGVMMANVDRVLLSWLAEYTYKWIDAGLALFATNSLGIQLLDHRAIYVFDVFFFVSLVRLSCSMVDILEMRHFLCVSLFTFSKDHVIQQTPPAPPRLASLIFFVCLFLLLRLFYFFLLLSLVDYVFLFFRKMSLTQKWKACFVTLECFKFNQSLHIEVVFGNIMKRSHYVDRGEKTHFDDGNTEVINWGEDRTIKHVLEETERECRQGARKKWLKWC